jgi:outer membrane protein assembly factor BamB
MACSDGNPCTLDSCDPVSGCKSEVLEDGTPCDDLEQCTIGDICLLGECRGVDVPEGAVCDDFDPCSKNDQCVEGTCIDPTYVYPSYGAVKFATDVGMLAEGATENPIVDRDGTVFAGVEGGVIAVDQCGEVLWLNETLGTPRWSAAVAVPGLLSVPVGSKIVDVDTATGLALRELDTAELFDAAEGSTIRILDLAVRRSGGLVVSLLREGTSTITADRRGMIAEIDALHLGATPLHQLGPRYATRVAIDADEAIVTVLRSGAPDRGVGEERLVRFGLDDLPETWWATSPVLAEHTELAFGPNDEVLWTEGLVAVTRGGDVRTVLERAFDGDPTASGSPATFARVAHLIETNAAIGDPGFGSPGLGDRLLAIDLLTGDVIYRRELAGGARRMSLSVDLEGTAFVLSDRGILHATAADGTPRFDALLPNITGILGGVATSLTPRGVVVMIAEGRVFGVTSTLPLANSSWPRSRRDNLATGHR